jgi:polyisoprenoid-binding protein YceI
MVLGLDFDKVKAAWALDPVHSTAEFAVKHMVVSTAKGRFSKFDATVTFDEAHPERSSVEARIDASSVDTRDERRDAHLRSADFFDVEKFPALTFRSTEVTDVTPAGAKLHGLLSIHGVEKPVVFDLVVHGEGTDPWGNRRSGVTATTRINRKEFGLNWNQALETGGVLVGDDVEIILEIEGLAKDEPAPTP